MLKDRKYVAIQACQTFDEIKRNMTEQRVIVSGVGEGGHVVHTFFHNEEKVGVKHLRMWLDGCVADKIIIVSLDGPTAFTKKEAENSHTNVKFFCFKDVCVNITRHSLVPPHEKVKESEIPFELTDKRKELPHIWTNDKVVQYYAFEPGDVIRIRRTSGSQEPTYYYRMVCHPPCN